MGPNDSTTPGGKANKGLEDVLFSNINPKAIAEIVVTLDNAASKGKRGGRVIPLSQTIRDALRTHYDPSTRKDPHHRIIQTERSDKVAPQVIVNMFQKWFADLGYEGCSSHSGRRTFITNASKKITAVGGSLRDIQYLAGHSSLHTTQRYIEGDSEARRKVVDII